MDFDQNGFFEGNDWPLLSDLNAIPCRPPRRDPPNVQSSCPFCGFSFSFTERSRIKFGGHDRKTNYLPKTFVDKILKRGVSPTNNYPYTYYNILRVVYFLLIYIARLHAYPCLNNHLEPNRFCFNVLFLYVYTTDVRATGDL